MKKLLVLFLLIFLVGVKNTAFAQFGEPKVITQEAPRNLYDEGYRTGFGVNIMLSDFGIGVGGQFRFGLNPYNQALLTLKIASLRDPSEQTFVDYYFGFKTVPEKYQRAFSVPLYIGLKRRFFAEQIADNFRVYAALSAGPVYSLSYAYFNDISGNGFRENSINVYGVSERINDIFSGFKQSESHWGLGGEFVLGIDFGDKFKNLSSVQFGYTMHYFGDGIQMMEPCQPDLGRLNQDPITSCGMGAASVPVYLQDGSVAQAPLEKANDPRKYFGSAQISFVFGWMW